DDEPDAGTGRRARAVADHDSHRAGDRDRDRNPHPRGGQHDPPECSGMLALIGHLYGIVSSNVPHDTHPENTVTRRTLLSAAAGGAAIMATRGLPAWARPVARVAGLRQPGSLPFPGHPEGTPSMPQIEHIVVS